MSNRLFGSTVHDKIHVFCLTALAMAIPFNKIAMSLSMMALLLNLIVEGDYKVYWNRIINNKMFLLIAGLFFLHFVGLLWTEDLNFGLLDIKKKLPLIVIPLIFTVKPITEPKRVRLFLIAFLSAICFITVYNFVYYQVNNSANDFRTMSLFSSHIRLAVMVIVAMAISCYFGWKKIIPISMVALIVLWLSYYTFYSQVITGMVCFLAAFVVITFIVVWKWNRRIAVSISILSAGLLFYFFYWLVSPILLDHSYYKSMPKKTLSGNDYMYSFDHISPDNGIAYYTFYNQNELREAWNNRSSLNYDSLDHLGQPVKNTLLRYLNDLKLYKDREGVLMLTNVDIKNIERGKTSRTNGTMLTRLYAIKHQIHLDTDPNGHSLLERIEFLKTGWLIFKDHPLLGVGTGDTQIAFDQKYIDTDSLLLPEKQFRAHNQFLTFAITFGIVGLCYFLFVLIQFFMIKQSFEFTVLAHVIFVIILSSFLLDDTLETQAGVSLFAYFFALFSSKRTKLNAH